jgi:hypothetical protein
MAKEPNGSNAQPSGAAPPVEWRDDQRKTQTIRASSIRGVKRIRIACRLRRLRQRLRTRAGILQIVAGRVDLESKSDLIRGYLDDPKSLFDVNGNTVGSMEIADD